MASQKPLRKCGACGHPKTAHFHVGIFSASKKCAMCGCKKFRR